LVKNLFFLVVLFQSLIGAGTVLCAALIAREMFGSAAAITAAALTAFYSYYLVHDTALQETSLFTLLTAVSVLLLLLRVRHNGSRATAAYAGVMLWVGWLYWPDPRLRRLHYWDRGGLLFSEKLAWDQGGKHATLQPSVRVW
jgi:hypothetical protein